MSGSFGSDFTRLSPTSIITPQTPASMRGAHRKCPFKSSMVIIYENHPWKSRMEITHRNHPPKATTETNHSSTSTESTHNNNPFKQPPHRTGPGQQTPAVVQQAVTQAGNKQATNGPPKLGRSTGVSMCVVEMSHG